MFWLPLPSNTDFMHVMDMLAGKSNEEVAKGVKPQNIKVPAEKAGSKVAQEEKSKKSEAEKWFDEHILGGYHAN